LNIELLSMNRIGVFTSGGDAPGMNACIRAVVRAGIGIGYEVYGIERGYQGMVDNEIIPMNARSVSNIIQRGGTILKTTRSKDFMTEAGMRKAYENLRKHQIDKVVAIGGDGTFRGAEEFHSLFPDVRFVGVPGTIDNDLAGTDFTLGFDTAVNTTLQAIDKIKDTAASHDRCFFIEVMGRDSGCIALWAAVCGGAEQVLLPEKESDLDALVKRLQEGAKNKKSSSIVIVAEGEKNGGAAEVAKQLKKRLTDYETKVTVLGHVQRGGSPTALDRMLGARFGVKAVETLKEGKGGVMIGIFRNELVEVPFIKAVKDPDPIDLRLIAINDLLAI
jgi:6-phosphofructokinase 1